MTDAERLLQLLLHDLRTPIGVAQGYLRMMQDGRLTNADEVERAVAKALHALGQSARLCQSAGDFLETSTGHARVTHVPAASFAAQVESIARTQGRTVEAGVIPASAVAVAGDVATLGDAVVLVLAAAGDKSRSMQIEADEGELRFLATEAPRTPRSAAAPFDGWSQSLPLAVACRRITWSLGQILKCETGNGLIVAFPLTGTPGKEMREKDVTE